jgi:hypothetical protein
MILIVRRTAITIRPLALTLPGCLHGALFGSVAPAAEIEGKHRVSTLLYVGCSLKSLAPPPWELGTLLWPCAELL